jgi:hypothetical protein
MQSTPLERVVPGLHLRRQGASALGVSHLNDEETSDADRQTIDGAVLPQIELEGLRPELPIGLSLDELDVGTLDIAI